MLSTRIPAGYAMSYVWKLMAVLNVGHDFAPNLTHRSAFRPCYTISTRLNNPCQTGSAPDHLPNLLDPGNHTTRRAKQADAASQPHAPWSSVLHPASRRIRTRTVRPRPHPCPFEPAPSPRPTAD